MHPSPDNHHPEALAAGRPPQPRMDPGGPYSDESLLRAAVLAGDGGAWRSLYERHFDALYAYVRLRAGGDGELSDEAVQECWLTAVRRLRDFDPGRGTFAAWLRGI